MKSIAIAFALSVCLFACKKEGGGNQQKETLISEVYMDGVKNIQFHYNSDNLVSKLESFSDDPANNSLLTYVNFKYNDKGHIEQYTAYNMPGNVAASKVLIEYDTAGKLVKASSYDLQGASPNTAQSITTFAYNVKGLVIKSLVKDKNAKIISQTNFIYYDNGHLKDRQVWLPNGDQLWMKSKKSFSLPSDNYPNGFEQLTVLLGADFIAGLYSEAISYHTYSQAGVVMTNWNQQMSGREYNEDGTLKKQAVTYVYIKPEEDDVSHVEEYKYIKQ